MTTPTPTLYSPIRLGAIELAHRIVMAPLTRNRAPHQQPTDLMVEYYRQRANPATGAALIITEASQIRPDGQGYLDTPGIFTPEQVAGWKKVTGAVHAAADPTDRPKIKATDANGNDIELSITQSDPVLYIFKTMTEAQFASARNGTSGDGTALGRSSAKTLSSQARASS